jgi:hypothetical protein
VNTSSHTTQGQSDDPDEYVSWSVDFPTAETPTVCAERTYQAADIAVFGADIWPLDAMNDDPSRIRVQLRFDTWPFGFRDFAKHVAYALINHGSPPSLLDARYGNHVKWPSSGTIQKILHNLKTHIDWLVGDWSRAHPDTQVRTLRDLDSEHLNECRQRVDRSADKNTTKYTKLEQIVRVWHLNPWLPPDQQWPEPVWRNEGWKPKRKSGDNSTKRLAQDTMGPLLEWSVAFVTQFADDILSAHTHYEERMQQTKKSVAVRREALRVLKRYAEQGMTIPAMPVQRGVSDTGRASWGVMEYKHLIDGNVFSAIYGLMSDRPLLSADPSAAALDFETSGKFHERGWAPFITVDDVKPRKFHHYPMPGRLVGHLRTACLIVAAYLTGARSEEIRGWEHGAAPDPIDNVGGSRLHLIRGAVWKGNHAKVDGTPRKGKDAVWATLPATSEAIHVTERIARLSGKDRGLLFTDTGRMIASGTATVWISEFVDFVNDRLVPYSADPAAFLIPSDPDGPITLSRFRRTLAWFIRNRPNGEAVAAIQYQHLSVVISGGYAGTKDSGMQDLLLEEDWRHRMRTIEYLRDLIDEGGSISGPASDRAIVAARKLPRHLTPADERRLRKDASMVVYENPAALALCVYDEENALCHKIKLANRNDQPNLLECIDGCRNSARTEKHIDALTSEAEVLRVQATLSPLPLAQAFIAEAERKLRIVEEHERNRGSQTMDTNEDEAR